MLERRTGQVVRKAYKNLALFDALEYYYALMTHVGSGCHSGMVKLFAVRTGGVDLGTVKPPDANIFIVHETDFSPDMVLRNSLVTNNYTTRALTDNLKAWLDILVSMIRNSICGYSYSGPDRDRPNDDAAFGSLDQKRWGSYPPSPAVLGLMNRLILTTARSATGDAQTRRITEQDTWLALEALRVTSDAELHDIVKSDGRGHPSPFNAGALTQWCDYVNTVTDIPTSDFKRILLPLFRICLNVARLLFGSVCHLGEEVTYLALSPDVQNLRISNETLLSIPMPTLALAQSFAEDEVLPISQLGLLYLDRLEAYYRSAEDTTVL